ncbi:GYD domain-containing protein [Bradyrhizobium genosp. P]|uniref:GYD domain-containing protein n=1 Tax=Bradyrhizobium genosp. P TaxID=83641 RepID=UPI003CE9EFA9
MPTAGQCTFNIFGCGERVDLSGSARKTRFHKTQKEHAMHFCLTGQYTPRALNAILENPATNRQEAARKVIEAAGGKLVSMYSVAADGPGVMVIFDVPDPSTAPAISGLTVTAGTLQNVKLTRLFTQDEIKQVRQNAVKLRPSYSPPGS